MAFWNLKAELIDIIEFIDESRNNMCHRFERHDNEIKNGAQLIVRPGQTAIFVNEGQIADVFQAGRYELSTQNLPVLSTLKGWKHGFDSPFKAEVYFVTTRLFPDMKWGTRSPFMYSSKFFTMEMRAFGMYSMHVTDPRLFYEVLVSTYQAFSVEEVNEKLRSKIVTEVSDAVNETQLPLAKLTANLSEISEEILKRVGSTFTQKFGVSITDFNVESFNMKEEDMEKFKEFEQLDTINMGKYQQKGMVDAMNSAAENPSGGSAGEGMGLGMGFAMANQMGQQFSQQGQNQQSTPPPPPVPQTTSFFVAKNGQQTGPFTLDQLKTMAQQNQFTRESLVWKEGMSAWIKASEVAETNSLFGQVPPPVPG